MSISDMKMLESAVAEHLRTRYAALYHSTHALAAPAKRLSDFFTHGREELPPGYMSDDGFRAAYIAHFLMVNAAKVMHCLHQIVTAKCMPKGEPLRIFDLGCGPGTAALAASLFFRGSMPKRRVEFTCADSCEEAIEDAKRIFCRIAPSNHSITTASGLLQKSNFKSIFGKNRYDFILASNFFNEIKKREESNRMCKIILDEYLSADGCLVIVDPALRITTRSLMALRDMIAGEAGAHVLAPCLHEKKCPMLALNKRDWCHFYIEWEMPNIIRNMDELVGTTHDYLKMGFLIIVSSGQMKENEHAESGRVVSSLLKSRGKAELVVCTDRGALTRLSRLERDASECNADFVTVKRGDVVRLPPANRIRRDERFEIVGRWQQTHVIDEL